MNEEKAMKIQKTYTYVRYLLLIVLLVLLGVASASAQEKTAGDYPKGKPIVAIFGDASTEFSDGKKTAMGFNVERAYMGYQYEVNACWKGKIVYDMGKGDDKTLQRIGYLKNAEVDYKKGNFALNLGLTSTPLYQLQEKFWGLRYVYMSYMDKRKWASSADLGALASYSFTPWFTADVSVFNGEGYKKIQNDDQLQYGLGMTVKPLDGWTLRAYTDFKTAKDTNCQQNIALFAGYECKAFRIGAEYNMELNSANGDGHHLYGVSVYGAGRLNDHAEFYARYDYGYSSASDGWESDHNNGHFGMLGLSWQVNKIFTVSPNFRINKADGQKSVITACVSGRVSF